MLFAFIEMVQIWNEVAVYVDNALSRFQGVSIGGLGTFTFFKHKLEIGNNRFLMTQKPVFVVSEKLAKTHGLAFKRCQTSGCIPIHVLNYTTISLRTGFCRDYVQLCVKHFLHLMNQNIAKKIVVEITFASIGKLVIKDSFIQMKFLNEFTDSLEQAREVLVNPDGYLSRDLKSFSSNQSVSFLF